MKKTPPEIRSLAIDAAQQCITAHGIQGVNARHIAKTIGCAVGTLYNHFKNIDALILEANLRTLTTLEAVLQQATAKTKPGDAAIKAIAAAYIDFALQNTNVWQTLFEHHMPKNAAVPETYYKQRKQLFLHIEKHLSLCHPNMSPAQLVLETRALWAGIQGICTLSIRNKLDDDNLPLESIVNTLVQHFLSTQGE